MRSLHFPGCSSMWSQYNVSQEKYNYGLLVKKKMCIQLVGYSNGIICKVAFILYIVNYYVSNLIRGSDRRCVAFTFDIDHTVITLHWRSSNK